MYACVCAPPHIRNVPCRNPQHTNTPHEEQLLWDAKCVSCVCAPNKSENKKKRKHTHTKKTQRKQAEKLVNASGYKSGI